MPDGNLKQKWYESLQRTEMRKIVPFHFYIVKKRFLFIVLTIVFIPVVELVKKYFELKLSISPVWISLIISTAVFYYVWSKYPLSIDNKEKNLIAQITYLLYKKSLLSAPKNSEKKKRLFGKLKALVVLFKD